MFSDNRKWSISNKPQFSKLILLLEFNLTQLHHFLVFRFYWSDKETNFKGFLLWLYQKQINLTMLISQLLFFFLHIFLQDNSANKIDKNICGCRSMKVPLIQVWACGSWRAITIEQGRKKRLGMAKLSNQILKEHICNDFSVNQMDLSSPMNTTIKWSIISQVGSRAGG